MKVLVDRHFKGDKYTIGRLYVDGTYLCDVLENPDRGLTIDTPLEEIRRVKAAHPGNTAIPTGTYEITLLIQSPRFKNRKKYRSIQGRLPRLLDVPGFEGVLIHVGNTVEDTDGCPLTGENKAKGQVLNSTKNFFKLYEYLKQTARGERIYITVQ